MVFAATFRRNEATISTEKTNSKDEQANIITNKEVEKMKHKSFTPSKAPMVESSFAVVSIKSVSRFHDNILAR